MVDSGSFSVECDASKSPVDSVTLFQTNRAEVKRKLKVELKDGQNSVEVKNLPTCLEESSIRVDGIGNATIFDVVYHPAAPYDYEKYVDVLTDLEARRSKITADIAILDNQSKFLGEYAKTLTGKDTDAEHLEAFLDAYAARKSKINEGATKLKDDLVQVQKEIQEKSKNLDADEDSLRRRGVRVTIVVLAEGGGNVELSLTYAVSHAWWSPQYDLRALIAPDTKSDSNVSLHYRASIAQKTGEDWTNVALTLSTAATLQGTVIPSLQPNWISERERPIVQTHSRRSGLPSFMSQMAVPTQIPQQPMIIQEQDRGRSRSYSPRRRRRARSPSRSASPPMRTLVPTMRSRSAAVKSEYVDDAPPPGFFRGRDSQATDGAVSTTFTITGLSTIPSGSNNEQQSHKVSIAELQFESTDLEWITVPKDVQSVFLRCKVKNTTKYVLLPGQANIFLNGSFVAKSSISHVSPQESFSCSLGVDPAVRITYHPQSKKTKTTGGTVLTTKMKTVTFEQAITVKNNRLTRLPRLLIKDRVHVSRDAKLKVNVLEPKGLSAGGKGKAVTLQNGVAARWVQRGGDDVGEAKVSQDESSAESAQGLLEWVCDIEPGATVDVSLVWEVSAPSDTEWVNEASVA
ncbi:hypothetical protein DFH11DRAFT_1543173 [Phellopilus nigrolimitatus]|nr:hypothetical protein DFH11DRAFT_1543173 [Phellopilus nigrolimitatus]